MKTLFVNNIGDLAEIQRASFYRFLTLGIQEELSLFLNPFVARVSPYVTGSKKKKCLVYLFPQEIKIKGPQKTFLECTKLDMSYTFQLFVDVEFSYPMDSRSQIKFKKASFDRDLNEEINLSNKKESKEQIIEEKERKKNKAIRYSRKIKKGNVLNFPIFLKKKKSKKNPSFLLIKQKMILAEIPLMTEEGTFYVHGCERIVVSQVIRSPGVYFQKQFGVEGNRIIYTATIISNKGLWTKFYLDFKSKGDFEEYREYKNVVKKLRKKNEAKWKNLEIDGYFREPEFEVEKPDAIFIRLSDFKRTADPETHRKEKEKDKRLYIDDLLIFFGISFDDLEDSLIDPKYVPMIVGYRGKKFYDKKRQFLEDYLEEQEEKLTKIEYIENFSQNEKSSLEKQEKKQKEKQDEEEIDKRDQNEEKWKEYLENKEIDTLRAQRLVEKFLLSSYLNCFSIGEIGRYRMNKRLGLRLPKQFTFLTSYDFIGIINGLLELKYFGAMDDDVDHIQNKMIRSVGELLQIQIRAGLYQLKKNLIERRKSHGDFCFRFKPDNALEDLEVPSPRKQWIIDPRSLTKNMKDFFKTSQLAQYMDQTNPLSEVAHKRRISVFGPNGLKRDHISNVIRDIHPSQYARICPIETPEGQNAGLISTLALYGRIGPLGCIETPYFFMKDKKIFVEKRPVYLNANQEAETTIAFCDCSFDSFEMVSNEYLSTKENYSFSFKRTETVHFITPSPIQMISLATALIPFVEHDDANRALMGSNMQRQAVPLLFTQKPIVGTGLESVTVIDSGMVIKAYHEGFVEYSSCTRIDIFDGNNQTIRYSLRKHYRSNQETYFHQRPIVWVGENVFSNQVIADGPGTNDGELALGRNLTIAYMPWEGYNYEDAIVLNERLILEDCLTSVHFEVHEINVNNKLILDEVFTRNVPNSTKYSRRNLGVDGIVRLGSYVRENDILIGKVTPYEEVVTPELLLYRALFETKEQKEAREKIKVLYKNTSCSLPKGMEGRVVEIRFLKSPYLIHIPTEILEETPEDLLEEISEDILEEIPETILDSVSEKILEVIPKKTTKIIPKVVPKKTTKKVTEIKVVPEVVPEIVPEIVPEVVPEVVLKKTKTKTPNMNLKNNPENNSEEIQKKTSKEIREIILERIRKIAEESREAAGKDIPPEIRKKVLDEILPLDKLLEIFWKEMEESIKENIEEDNDEDIWEEWDTDVIDFSKNIPEVIPEKEPKKAPENKVKKISEKDLEEDSEDDLKENSEDDSNEDLENFYGTIRLYVAQIRKIQIGDKLAGRHGNKGIVSRILASQDMPYLPDGSPIDIVFNPLGVPSRMNVGQIFECLLGLAGEKLGNRYKIIPFDEIYGREASRILVNQKLKQTSLQPNFSWIFDPMHPGKILLRDGRTGEYFDNPITVGKSYILKLIHLVEDKIHARSTGPYAMITEQPLAGKSQKGGQRFGEMEVWALEAYGCSNILQELLTIKSDDIDGRNDMYEAIVSRTDTKKPSPSLSETFLALIRELNALGLDFSAIQVKQEEQNTKKMKKIEKDLFKEIERRLHIRSSFDRKKTERFYTDDPLCYERIYQKQKAFYKERILKQFKKIREEHKNRE